MIKEEALDAMWMRCRHNDKTFEAYCVLKRELGLNELDGVDRVKTELEPELNELEPKYCDRNICLSNEYNGISCDECEVMKSQEPCDDAISRREAIKMFTYNYKGERISDYDCDNFPVQIAMKTVKEMLRGLPSVNPQEPCDDAISRAELVRKLNAWDCKVNGIPNYVWQVIRELPSVTPAEKVGHWYKKPHEICYTCDQCRTTNASGVRYDYCPHCGAKMKEDNNGTA